MASPVDTSVKFHLSTFANAPVLSKTVGSRIGLLDAFLVDGYDTKTLTSLVVSGGVATATFTGGHSAMPETVVRIAGCTGGWTDLNGDQKVIAKTGTTVQFATALSNGTATGTITMRMAPAGWEKVYSGTNKAVYRSTNLLSPRMYLRVDDNATRWAIVTGYETMSDVDTGLAAFPTAAQALGGGYWQVSSASSDTASATPRPYQFVGDDRFFMLTINTPFDQSTSWFATHVRGFGDLIPLAPAGDPYAVILNCGRKPDAENDSAFASNWQSWHDGDLSSGWTSKPTYCGSALARPHTGSGSATHHMVYPQSMGLSGNSSFNYSGDGWLGAFPSVVDGAMYLSRQIVTTASNNRTPRAYVPGLFHLPQTQLNSYFSPGDVVPAGGALTGRKLLMISALNSGSTSTWRALCAVDITGPWR